MKKKIHKPKLRYVFCISAIALILAGYFVFLCTYCRTYTISLILNGDIDISNVRVEMSEENIVKPGNIRIGSFADITKTLDIDLTSVNQGNVDVTVSYEDIYDWNQIDNNGNEHPTHATEQKKYEASYLVLPFGMIWCTSFDDFHGLWTVKLLANAIMIVLIITFSLSFHEKQKSGNFTYSMVTLGGVIFFLSVTVIFSLYDTFSAMEFNSILNFTNILYSVSKINTTFVNVTFIPLLAFCLAISISNIQLVRHEGFSIFNLLGIILGTLSLVGIVMIYFFGNELYMYSEAQQILMVVINTAVSFLFCYLECLLVSTVFCALMSTRYRIKTPMDYIIILGCAIRNDGTPTPILRGRIDRAVAFEKEQYKKWNKHAKFVPSGGQGSDEIVSEAECMKRYLMEQGIPEERILKEDKSVNTYQNMAFSKKIIESDTDDLSKTGVAFSTTNYHVFRGYILAQKIGMKAKGLSSKTKLYFFPNAFLREFIGLLVEQKVRHLFFIASGIVFFASLYFIVQY